MRDEEDELLGLIHLETRGAGGEESEAIGDPEQTRLDQVTPCGDVNEEGVEFAGRNPTSSSWIYLVRGRDHPDHIVAVSFISLDADHIVREMTPERGVKEITDALSRPDI